MMQEKIGQTGQLAAVAALDSEVASLQELDRAHTHYRGVLGRLQDEKCRHRGCNLPMYQNGLCEPCWEIGRDEF